MTTTKLPRRGILCLPAKPIEPVRPVTDCDTCHYGCDCDSSPEHPGCEHWGCWGRAATNDCPIGADALREHLHAYMAYREALFAYQQTSHLR